MNEIIVVTDASFCPETKAGAWAVACNGPNGFTHGDLFDRNVGSSNSAEMWAMFRGLSLAIERGAVASGGSVVLCLDNTFVIARISKFRVSVRQKRREASGKPWNGVPGRDTPPGTHPFGSPLWGYYALVAEHRLTVDVVRIAGHGGGKTKRRVLMAQVDALSRRLMKEERGRRRQQPVQIDEVATLAASAVGTKHLPVP